jgi:hypothetical protein
MYSVWQSKWSQGLAVIGSSILR